MRLATRKAAAEAHGVQWLPWHPNAFFSSFFLSGQVQARWPMSSPVYWLVGIMLKFRVKVLYILGTSLSLPLSIHVLYLLECIPNAFLSKHTYTTAEHKLKQNHLMKARNK